MNTHLFECNEPEINNTYLSRGSLHKTIFKFEIQYFANCPTPAPAASNASVPVIAPKQGVWGSDIVWQ